MSPPQPQGSPRRGDIGPILVSTRGLEEYRAMFDLADEDLEGRVLDCPGGAAGFTAEVLARGGDATAVDPIYSRPREELVDLALREPARGNRYVREHPDEYVWTWFPDVDAHLASRRRAGRIFARHFGEHPGRYLAAGLPRLPLPDDDFDLVLSSHLLFTYGDRLDLDFHREGIVELARVARGEVRLFPLVMMGSFPYPHLEELRRQLEAIGLASELRPVPYEFQRGGNRMLVVDHPGR